ncbi:MAG: hypothetical protein GX444_10415 [Myxococcales bacterium]|nr:hypothetical protein [Myxococcales bacterium]
MKTFSLLVLLAVLGLGVGLALSCSSSGSGDDDSSSDDDAVDDDTTADDDTDDDDVDDDDSTVTPYPESCANGPVFSFDLASRPMVVPFPNDLYTIEDAQSRTGRRVHIDEDTARPIGAMAAVRPLKFLIDAFNDLNGFSTLADIYLPTGEEPAWATLPDLTGPSGEDGVFLMADDPGSSADGLFVPLKFDFRSPDLHLTPWFPLKENTHYILVATRGLAPQGRCYQASESMREIWRAWIDGTADETTERYRAALTRLDGLGVPPDQILSIADFTTGWITRDLEAAVGKLDTLFESSPSAFRDWEIVPDGDPSLWATAHAVFDVPIFKPDGEPWAFDSNGTPIVDHYETLRAYFTIPAAEATPGGQPYPIVIFEHGIMSDMHELRPPFTTEIARRGFAMIAIDAICHGDRLPPGTGEVGQLLCFFDIFHPGAMRDNFRETASNFVWLTRAVATLKDVDLDGNGTPDFDTTRIYGVGSSFGSGMGGMSASVDRNVEAQVLNASGAKLTNVLVDGGAAPVFLVISLIEKLLLPEEPITDFIRILMDLLQSILDPADPANYVMHAIDDPLEIMEGHQPQILQQSGAFDEEIGGPSGGWLCRAGGWPQMIPYVWDAGVPHVTAPYEGSAFYQFDTSEHHLIFDDDPLSPATREQIFHFLETHFNTGIGEIIDPLATDTGF